MVYKNVTLTTLFFCYMFISDYSGSNLFDGGLLMFYNLLFTTLPVIAVGVFDEDLPPAYGANHSQTFYQGIFNLKFNGRLVFKFVLSGLFHGFLIFFLVVGGLWGTILHDDGHVEDWGMLCGTLYAVLVLTVIGFIALNT
jgi:phospholipid-translocating ATPase